MNTKHFIQNVNAQYIFPLISSFWMGRHSAYNMIGLLQSFISQFANKSTDVRKDNWCWWHMELTGPSKKHGSERQV